ncbi:hypothetical protein [Luteolibacter sp. Populi]|uniref:hypothetical protein n=1 Tax=Luteolibacter sp. Populi TaxID=3230487 RepID=UPI00346719D6
MTRAPGLLRSVTFWSGILMMVFICWAWRDSNLRPLEFRVKKWHFSQAFSGVTVQRYWYYQPKIMWGTVARHFTRHPLPAPFYASASGKSKGDDREYHRRGELEGKSVSEWVPIHFEYLPRGARLLFIPHWLILLGVAGVWGGLLYERHRRMRRAFAIQEVPAGDG